MKRIISDKPYLILQLLSIVAIRLYLAAGLLLCCS